MSTFTETILVSLGSLIGIMVFLWLISLVRRDASIIDPFWGSGFAIVAGLAFWWNTPVGHRSLLLMVLTTLWGLRLSLYLLWRNWGHSEDHRYAAMRQHHGSRFALVSLFTVFLLQGLILWFVSLPVQAGIASGASSSLHGFDAIGFALWSVGITFETVGDWQLARFKADPGNQGRVMDRGLWKYTRHPNYFGDFCVWWGIYLLSVPAGAAWTIGSPLLMSFLLIKVSGVSLLEQTITDRRPDYAAYQARTSPFFPAPPKKV